jgi:hypothetical protein
MIKYDCYNKPEVRHDMTKVKSHRLISNRLKYLN